MLKPFINRNDTKIVLAILLSKRLHIFTSGRRADVKENLIVVLLVAGVLTDHSLFKFPLAPS